MPEIWKPISGYESAYEVSSAGQVRALKKVDSMGRDRPAKVMKQWKRSNYLLVDFYREGKRDVRSVHRLVYEAFVGPVPDGHHVHHLNEDKYDNRADNLATIDGSEHVRQHSIGRQAWNKGMKYGETEGYKKGLEKRRETFRKRRESKLMGASNAI